nr:MULTISPECIES: tripartite tricarboxylate transporter substrate binding protein [unclassified Acidovorax]
MLCAVAPIVGAPAFAQSWPSKPIRLVVPFPPGGGTDAIARELAGRITVNTKWAFVIDNKPGSGGNIGVDFTAKAPADGYTFVIGQTSNLAINPTLYSKLPYDPAKDLTPIVKIGSAPLAIVVSAGSPYQSLADVMAAAKAQPGLISFATSGNGTVAHLTGELLQKEAGVKFTHVPYKGAAQGLTDVIGGSVHLYLSSVPTLISQIKNGKLRALAVTSERRVSDLPQVPTVAESGYKGFEASTWFGLLGPANLPRGIASALNAAANNALGAEELTKKLGEQGVVIAGGGAEPFSKLIRDDMVKWGKVVKESGAKVD